MTHYSVIKLHINNKCTSHLSKKHKVKEELKVYYGLEDIDD